MEEKAGEVTKLLRAWAQGEEKALESLLPLVYNELQRIARRRMQREDEGHTLPAAALIHEAYLRLVSEDIQWQNRAHFFAVASRAMRRILVDHARRKRASKRGGGDVRVSVVEAVNVAGRDEVDVVALNEALEELFTIDSRQFQIVELRYFGGLTIEETAEVLGVSLATVKNDWAVAKAWLYRQLA